MSENSIGWTGYQWVSPVPCVACENPITSGIVSVSTLRLPIMPKIFRALCWPCWYAIPPASNDWAADSAKIITGLP
jgi:hypothetical protein